MLVQENHFDQLEKELHSTNRLSSDLIASVIANACPRSRAVPFDARRAIARLIENGAWIDATLKLIEVELPLWKLRRVVYDDGQWLCSLSRQPTLPLDLDEVAEASHETLPLAILSAFIQARRMSGNTVATDLRLVPKVKRAADHALCCDNFC